MTERGTRPIAIYRDNFGLPIRVDIATGAALPSKHYDPYMLPWVDGAALTLPSRTRKKYEPFQKRFKK